ncbi:MAG: hypothetical protein L3J83_02170 [Proteobacteria bacterium]|nr:hypothetical protein [Pseudomonadota bacterium]
MAGVFASYCQLLKKQLIDQWVVNRENHHSDVVIVDSDCSDNIDCTNSIKIIIGDFQIATNANDAVDFSLNLPVTSSKVVKLLNDISLNRTFKKRNFIADKKNFSLKKMLSKFIPSAIHTRVRRKSQQSKNAKSVVNQLLRISNPGFDKHLKVVFLGRPWSGKTTAISSVGESFIGSDVKATDSVGLLKEQTTIGIDYNECSFENGTKLRLYGTPGQIRYDYVQSQTVKNADIYIILVDLTSVAPFAEFIYYKNIIESAGNTEALKVAAFTHNDIREHNPVTLSKEIRLKYHSEILTVKLDVRKREEVLLMLENVAKIQLSDVPIQQDYAENSMFKPIKKSLLTSLLPR